MTWFRRIAFFLILNISVMIMLSLVTTIFGVQPYLSSRGFDMNSLMVFCLIWGMGGAFISLLLSKTMAKWTLGVRIIDPETRDPGLRELVDAVHRLSTRAGISRMPEVGIYDSLEVNAFATGATKNRSLVAVSTGLLSRMDSQSVEGVLGHEVTHIANGDMVTMTLLQGVVNAFVMALARIIAFAIDNALRGRDDRGGGGLGYFGRMIAIFVLEMLLFIPGSMLIAAYSRYREFRADAGGAKLAGKENMISALRRLQLAQEYNESHQAQNAPSYAAMKISGRKSLLFSTHPPLDVRIARLEGRQ